MTSSIEIPIIRLYEHTDKEWVLKLFRLNTPGYFAQKEEHDLVYYLDNEIDQYFLLVMEGRIVGCGGINFSGDRSSAKISWDFLHPDFYRRGLGTRLLHHRLQVIKKVDTVKAITVRTSQHAFQFYQSNGFEVVKIVKDYWALGFDLYAMEYTWD